MLLLGAAQLAPGAKLVAIDAFHGRGRSDQADVFDIVAAIDRLVEKSVSVANLSFAGAGNELLARAGERATERGMILVAAAGNQGPTAPPQYPAAYRWAVAVTAVDNRNRVYPRAVRGPHLAFAAPGVRMQLPDNAMQPGPIRSGTSYAVPWVTAAIAGRRGADTGTSRQSIVESLARDVTDLGAPGRDAVYGWGLLEAGKACIAG